MAFFMPWLSVPDLMMPALLYIYYYRPNLPLWRAMFVVSLLMDLSANVHFGFYGLFYGLFALALFPLRFYWKSVSDFMQIFLLFVIVFVFAFIKIFLLYVFEGVHALKFWWLTILFQFVLWVPMRFLTLWVLRFFPNRKRA